jgi:hypothetical protein
MATETRGLTIKDCARILQRSEKTVRRYLQRGWLISKRVPGPHGEEIRVEPKSLDRLKKVVSRVSKDEIPFTDLYELYTRAPRETRELVLKILTSPAEEGTPEPREGKALTVIRSLFKRS